MVSRSPFPTTSTPEKKAPAGPGPKAPAPKSPFGRPGGDDDFVIDLSGAEKNDRRIPGEGRHYAYATKIVKETSQAGNPMLTWTFTIWGGDYSGMSLNVWTALTPNAMWKLDEICKATGFPMPENRQFKLGELREQALRTLVEIEVVHGTYNGRPSASISYIDAPSEYEVGTKVPSAGTPQ